MERSQRQEVEQFDRHRYWRQLPLHLVRPWSSEISPEMPGTLFRQKNQIPSQRRPDRLQQGYLRLKCIINSRPHQLKNLHNSRDDAKCKKHKTMAHILIRKAKHKRQRTHCREAYMCLFHKYWINIKIWYQQGQCIWILGFCWRQIFSLECYWNITPSYPIWFWGCWGFLERWAFYW